ncbi:hypothetical protein HAX54_029888 [Datura stramonium]|uniref:Uncharacterized protein n=1 Tax=Datura stramonium TaxID=4076 RepID=A0ABS8V7M2_DATST|nr:hypothetical protein [Datura stramonium]
MSHEKWAVSAHQRAMLGRQHADHFDTIEFSFSTRFNFLHWILKLTRRKSTKFVFENPENPLIRPFRYS